MFMKIFVNNGKDVRCYSQVTNSRILLKTLTIQGMSKGEKNYQHTNAVYYYDDYYLIIRNKEEE